MPKHIDPKLVAYLNEQVDALRELLPAAVTDGEVKAVHHARVATRRLSAAMHTMSPVLGSHDTKAFNKSLKHVRQALGSLRDLDVMLGHLAEVPGERPAVEWLAGQLKQKREKQREQTAGEIDVSKESARLGSWWGIRPQLLDTAAATDGLLGQSLHLQLDAFAESADRLVDPAEKFDPHVVRIAGKSLRYTLEMAVAAGHKLPRVVVGAFKRMQDALGAWHDMAVLTETILKLSLKHELPLHDLPVQADLLTLAGGCLRQGRRQLSKFETVWRQHRPTLPETIRRAFPLTTEMKTGPGPLETTGSETAGATGGEDSPGTG